MLKCLTFKALFMHFIFVFWAPLSNKIDKYLAQIHVNVYSAIEAQIIKIPQQQNPQQTIEFSEYNEHHFILKHFA